jgi:hypothetical protein
VRRGQRVAASVRDNVGELDLSWRTKERASNFLFVLEICKRGLLYVLAFFSIIAAGCLSGLPSATCFALEDAYTIGLTFIGGLTAALIVIASLAIYTFEHLIKKGKDISSKLDKFGVACGLGLPVLVYIFAISFLTVRGVNNISTAIEHCRLVTSDASSAGQNPSISRCLWRASLDRGENL